MALLWVTIRVAVISTSVALLIGLPIGVALGIGRFRGRRALQILANASLALPPVVVGVVMLLLLIRPGAFGSLHLAFTLRARLHRPDHARAALHHRAHPCGDPGPRRPACSLRLGRSGAGRLQLATFALREAKIGVLAATIAALGATISEVGAVVIIGGNIQGHDETLASAMLEQFNYTPPATRTRSPSGSCCSRWSWC